jgi:hypothetical protein
MDSPEADDQAGRSAGTAGENPKDCFAIQYSRVRRLERRLMNQKMLCRFCRSASGPCGFASSLKHLRPLFLAGVNVETYHG